MSNSVHSLAASLEAKRALLAERLRRAAGEPRQVPLSFAQQRLWFLDQLAPNSPLYNIATVAQLTGKLNVSALEQALQAIVARHESLRTGFALQEDTPMQVVERERRLRLRRVELASSTRAAREAEARKLMREEVGRPFKLGTDTLARATLFRLDTDEHWLLLVIHHIVADEWSLKIIFRELAALYEGFVGGGQPSLPELPIQYADYAVWQRNWLSGESLERQLRYWKEHLGGNPPVLELPGDHPHTSALNARAGNAIRNLNPGLAEGLKETARAHDSTLFMVLLAGFEALLYRYTGQEDLVLATPIAGRNRVETEGVVGFFVNTLALRTSIAGNPTFNELLARVRQTTLGAFAHQDVPFERLVQELQPERILGQMPLSRLMFVLQNGVPDEFVLPGLRLQVQEVEGESAKFDLTLVAGETRDGLALRAEYNRDLFEPATIERLLEHFEILLAGAVAQPDCQLSDLPLLSERERHQLRVDWNRTRTDYPRDKCIHELFEAQAASTPGARAVAFGPHVVTYGELNASANQLAHYLRKLGVGPEMPVAICVQRSVEMVVGLLAILKSGGAYVPLDPSYPTERLEFMLSDTGARVLLTQQHLRSKLPAGEASSSSSALRSLRVICLDTDWELVARESRENPTSASTAEHLAYIMYTSGSTGRPKGVAVPHRGVNRLVLNTNYIRLDATDRIAQVSNVSFDAATFEIWGALLNGGQLIGITRDIALSPKDFARELREQGITAMFLTAALFSQLAGDVPGAFASLRTLIAGGEALDPKWVRAVLRGQPPQRLVNGYGPTENTTFTCCCELRGLAADVMNVPIGRPIANTQVYILDAHLNPVPIGVPGELYTGGDGLARGYWNRPELTAEKFIPNPFIKDASHVRPCRSGSEARSYAQGKEEERDAGATDESAPRPSPYLYKTGDLARFLPDGNIQFLGRLDQQVKIRGFRIEPGEVENALSQHPGVQECVVTALGEAGVKQLVAYVVAREGSSPSASELRAFLGQKLPHYMVPSAFVTLRALPLTANGKLDRRALPAPDHARPELDRRYIAPRDVVEQQLAGIWEQVLGVHPVGIADKFFDLGGHSLLAVRLVARIEKAFGRKLRLATIFQAPTVEQLAALLRGDEPESNASADSAVVEIRSRGTRPPLYFVHGAGGGMFWGYTSLSRHLGSDQPVFGFQSSALRGREEPGRIEDMAARYAADLRQAQPNGPYYLAGYCFGGVVAYEMARQLCAAGAEVALLALLNCAPPNSPYTRIPWTLRWARRFARNLLYWANYFRQWNPTQRREFLRWKWGLLRKRLARWRDGNVESSGLDAGELVDLSSYSEEQRHVWETHIQALLSYHPQPYPGRVHLFRSPGHPLWCSFDPDYGWGDLALGGVERTIVPGAHEKIMEEPCVEVLAGELAKALESAQSRAPLKPGPDPAGSVPVSSSSSAKMPAAQSEDEQENEDEVGNGVSSGMTGNVAYPRYFEAQVERTPSAVALRFQGEQLTYAELNARANQLARSLQELGVGPEMVVAVCLERSLDLMVGLLAIWKAGGAYLPLDPDYPPKRLAYMLADSRAPVLLTQTHLLSLFETRPAKVLCLDEPEQQQRVGRASHSNLANAATASNLAYVIYTSGSTGEPKGVEITHRALLNHHFAVAGAYQLNRVDRVLQVTPFSFDISIEEVFPSWLCGCTVVLRSEDTISSPARFLECVAREGITVLNLPTAYWHELVEFLDAHRAHLPPAVRLVIIGGETASTEAFRRWKQRVNGSVTLINAYGPTEATITTTLYKARPDEEALPIGRPIANTHVLLLDEQLQPVPPGEPGELCIGGAGLARGYLHRPDLTAERFVQHNGGAGAASERVYRTGDLARLRPDGNLEFLGRLDEQIKIRGYRVELAEVQAVLQNNPAIREAAVVAREDGPGGKRLVAYFVPRTFPPPGVSELLNYFHERLPGYMSPSAFVALQALPLTPAGKVDRTALPPPEGGRPALEQEFVAPSTALEEKLAAIWCEVLGVEPIGVQDHFLELGGHSLLAVQVLSRIRDLFGVEVPLRDFFAHPTLASLAGHIAEAAPQSRVREGMGTELPSFTAPRAAELHEGFGTGDKRGSEIPLLPLPLESRFGPQPASFVQERLWFLDQLRPGTDAYHVRAAFRIKGCLECGVLERAVGQIVRRHEILRTAFQYANNRLTQTVVPDPKVEFRFLDLSSHTSPDRQAQARQWLETEGQRPFDLTRAPLLRTGLVRLSHDDHFLLVTMHHAISDGWSLAIFFQELEVFYNHETTGTARALPDLPVQYIDFAHWQRQWMQGERLEEQLAYWREALAGAPSALDLPFDNPDKLERPGPVGCTELGLDHALVKALRRLGRQEAATPFMVLLTALAVTLYKWTGQQDLVLGTVVAGRTRRQLENVIGCFMNFLPLRLKFSSAETGAQVLTRVRATVLEGQTHQDCPFERIVGAINPERRLNQNPLYNVALLLQNFPPEIFRAHGLEITPVRFAPKTPLLDLRLEGEALQERGVGMRPSARAAEQQATEWVGTREPGVPVASDRPGSIGGEERFEQKMSLTCEYGTDLFHRATVDELLASFHSVLETLVQRPQTRIEDFQVTPALVAQAAAVRDRQKRETLAVSANFTAEPLAEPLRYWMKELGLPAGVEFAPYNQVFQQLLDPASLLAGNGRGLNIICLRLEDWQQPASVAASSPEQNLQRNIGDFISALKGATTRQATPYLVCLCPPSRAVAADPDRAALLGRMEQLLVSELSGLAGAYVLTAADLAQWYPVADYDDPGTEGLGHVPYTPLFFTALATAIARKFHALLRPPTKVIALDCDQTLWAGVCGEDGPWGVRLDAGRQALQEFMRRQHEAGVLLCLCSKNNAPDALAVFNTHPEMPLKREHFAACRLNWQPKSENLKALAQELNAGLDSFVLVDDNPVECAEVEANCPGVLTLQLPADPDAIPDFLNHCWVFDHVKLTEEDRRRAERYQQNREREQLRLHTTSLADFLEGLELKIEFAPMSGTQLARVAQLTQRTNQFNCNPRRLGEGEVRRLLSTGREALTVQVSDRFGDYGLTGVVFCRYEPEALEVESFLLSCRVLGRGIEHQMLARLGTLARERGAKWVNVHFTSTARNQPARDFLESVGGQYKNSSNGLSVFRFPADFAATVSFKPAGSEAIPASNSSTTGEPQQSRDTGRVPKFAACLRIALEADDVGRIHERIGAEMKPRVLKRPEYVPPQSETQRQLCELWERLLRVERVGLRDNFFELGGHSLLAVRLFAEVEKITGRKFPLVTLFQAPTLEELAAVLSQGEAPPSQSLLVCIQAGKGKPPLFLVHGAGGDVLWGYANLAAHLPGDQPVYGIKSRGQVGLEELGSLNEMAAYYLGIVRAFQPQGPYYLGGYCFGGNVAYEMARQLEAQGQEVAVLALLDSSPAGVGYETVPWWRPGFAYRFAGNFCFWLRDFVGLASEERRRFMARKMRALSRKWKRRLQPGRGPAPVDLEEVIDLGHFPEKELKLWQIHLQALANQRDRNYSGSVTLLRTRGQPLFCSLEEDFCWGKLAQGGVVVKRIPGAHENVFMEPNVKALAQALAESLAEAQGRHEANHSLAA